MQRRGKTSARTQRWFCRFCLKSSVRLNPYQTTRHRQKLFVLWLCGTESLASFAKKHGESRRTFQRWFEPFWNDPPAPKAPASLENQSLIVDAVSIEPRHMMALIGRTRNHVVWWSFAETESFDSWSLFCSNVPTPKSVVCDGQRGLFAAILGRWPMVMFQRCLIHVVRQSLAKLTRHPKTLAGQSLRKLVTQLPSIRTRRQKRKWIHRWKTWRKKYHRFLAERSYGDVQNKRRGWWYTHKKLRAVRSLIQNSMPYLFTFIGHPEIPRTSNHVEGGINSRLKELLHRHRGFSLQQKQALVSWFLTLKQPKKPPRNVL
jgi:hypothetical protein